MRIHKLSQGLVGRLTETPQDKAKIKDIAERLVEQGEESETHAGMVRAIVFEYLEFPWQKTQELAASN